jgi:hypothetical protein
LASGDVTIDEAAAVTAIAWGLALLPKGPCTSGIIKVTTTWTLAGEMVALSRHAGSKHRVNARSAS